MKVNVHIENLRLTGLPVNARDSEEISSAISAAVAQVLADASAVSRLIHGGQPARVSAPPVSIPRRVAGADLGHQIGTAIARGMVGQERGR
jgi:hypothetical protein